MASKKRVLICGVSGFLGKNIFEHLIKRDDLEVRGTFLTNRYGRIDPNDPRLSKADLTKEEEVNKITAGFFGIKNNGGSAPGFKNVKKKAFY